MYECGYIYTPLSPFRPSLPEAPVLPISPLLPLSPLGPVEPVEPVLPVPPVAPLPTSSSTSVNEYRGGGGAGACPILDLNYDTPISTVNRATYIHGCMFSIKTMHNLQYLHPLRIKPITTRVFSM